jgi:antitoxin component YwqK of YwqJK toxin-antitoxin module
MAGLYEHYDTNGLLRFQTFYRNGGYNGVYNTYSSNGKLYNINYYL